MLQLQGCNFRTWKRPMGCICRPNFTIREVICVFIRVRVIVHDVTDIGDSRIEYYNSGRK